MAKALTISMDRATAQATSDAIAKAFTNYDALADKASATLQAVCPLLLRLDKTGGWKLLDNIDSEGKTDHKTIGAWAEQHFNRSHGAISETLNVARRFYNPDTYEILSDYADYSYTQLIRMKSLKDADIQRIGINPEMSAVAIKKAIVDDKKANTASAEASTVDTKTDDNVSRETLANQIEQATGEKPQLPEPDPMKSVFGYSEVPKAVQKWFDTLGIDTVTITKVEG